MVGDAHPTVAEWHARGTSPTAQMVGDAHPTVTMLAQGEITHPFGLW